jgi:hypothetical protein
MSRRTLDDRECRFEDMISGVDQLNSAFMYMNQILLDEHWG